MESVPVDELRLDWELYPRRNTSSEHVTALVDAMDMGVRLPPVVVWKDTRQVIDGFHRTLAYRKRRPDGADTTIPVEWREYGSKADAFAAALELNAGHGRRLGEGDRERIMQRAHELGLRADRVSRALKVPISRLEKRQTGHVVKSGTGQRKFGDDAQSILDQRVRGATRTVIGTLAKGDEPGPGYLKDQLARVAEARERDEAELRSALLDTAALFIGWAARL